MDVSIKAFRRCTHINLYIIACLQREKALDELQASQLSGEKSLIKRSEMILQWIQKNQALYDSFLRVMENEDQQHVSNLLKGVKTGPHIPLSDSRYNQLISIKPKLMLTIRNDEELVAKLRAKHAISEIDCQDITQGRTEYKRNWNLIEAILRRSEYAFDCFEQTLKETLQYNVASYLHEGHVVAVHANTTRPETDEVISDLLNKTILSESKDDTPSEEKILTPINGYNIHPVAAKPGQSIVLFLYCKTVDDMITFTELFISGKLKSIVEVILNRLWLKSYPENTEQLKADLRLDEGEILEVEKFSGIEDWMPVELEKATIESKILQNVATHTELQFEKTKKSSDDWMSVELEKATIGSKILQNVATHTELQFEVAEESSDSDDVPSGFDSVYDFTYERSKKLYLSQRAKRKGNECGKVYFPDLKPSRKSSETKPPKTTYFDQLLSRIHRKISGKPSHRPYLVTSQGTESTTLASRSFKRGDLSSKETSHGDSERTLLTASAEERRREDELRIKYNSERGLIAIIRPRADKEKKAIAGLTILDKELFVLYQKTSEVDVYDSEKFIFCRRLNLEELIHQMDIGSCNRNKCLYIFDYKDIDESSEILRVDSTGKLIKNWSTGNDWGCGLSVTDETNVILAVFYKNKLNEYSPDGQLIREISLSSEACICFPKHAVQLTKGHFVVSLCDYAADIHRVCIVDAVGKLETSFGGGCGSTIGEMNTPVYLAVGKDGHVMVVDRGNNRVLLLDSDLKFMSEILTREKHGLRNPMRILLDQANAKLFVSEDGEGYARILAFDFEVITKL